MKKKYTTFEEATAQYTAHTGEIPEVGAMIGLYFVDRSPGDPSWCGRDYSLKKIGKTGKISKAKYNICFWPICSCVSDRYKTAEANAWNKEHAQIEVKAIKNMAEVAAHFQAEADSLNDRIRWTVYNFGEDHPEVAQLKALQAHYEAVAKSVKA